MNRFIGKPAWSQASPIAARRGISNPLADSVSVTSILLVSNEFIPWYYHFDKDRKFIPRLTGPGQASQFARHNGEGRGWEQD
ncbi:MAG: hypothetical protein Devi2KO_34650 [Devosia indica]